MNLIQEINLVEKLMKILMKKFIDIKYDSTVSVYYICLNLDKKEDYPHGIYMNSRYLNFYLHNSKLKLDNKGYELPKFRTANIRSAQDIINKINTYINSVN